MAQEVNALWQTDSHLGATHCHTVHPFVKGLPPCDFKAFEVAPHDAHGLTLDQLILDRHDLLSAALLGLFVAHLFNLF